MLKLFNRKLINIIITVNDNNIINYLLSAPAKERKRIKKEGRKERKRINKEGKKE